MFQVYRSCLGFQIHQSFWGRKICLEINKGKSKDPSLSLNLCSVPTKFHSREPLDYIWRVHLLPASTYPCIRKQNQVLTGISERELMHFMLLQDEFLNKLSS